MTTPFEERTRKFAEEIDHTLGLRAVEHVDSDQAIERVAIALWEFTQAPGVQDSPALAEMSRLHRESVAVAEEEPVARAHPEFEDFKELTEHITWFEHAYAEKQRDHLRVIHGVDPGRLAAERKDAHMRLHDIRPVEEVVAELKGTVFEDTGEAQFEAMNADSDANGKEAPRIELVKDTINFLTELVGTDVLLPATNEEETDPELQIEGVPFDVSSDRADQLVADMKMWLDRERRGIHEDHPLVRCTSCGETATHCEMGNSYCPSCGESLDGAPEVPDTRDIIDVLTDEQEAKGD